MKKNAKSESVPNPQRSNADEGALELMRQLITLASGVLALSATFIEKLSTESPILLALLAVSWVILLTSVFFGLETISSIVQSRLQGEEEWSKGYGKKSARISKYAFVLGIAFFALFAFLSIVNTPPKEPKGSQPKQSIFVPDTARK